MDTPFNLCAERTLLWQNANPSAAFGAQTIQLSVDLAQFDYVHIIMTGVNMSDVSAWVEPGGAFTFSSVAPSANVTSAYVYGVTRSGQVLDGAVRFDACQAGYNGAWSLATTNRMIPTKIYGIKF